MKEKHYEIEETDLIKQDEHGVSKMILVVAGLIVLACVIYFFTHLTRPV
ncbi:MAG: hypothetical protein HN919_21175 [Verrucomicrobia bacterium]|jgi:hypothetical protein|nr:hypothetical protein [Verrucomicrobiota bacterium]MBT7068821.1 hypothetical protein [Verrucomicrobiota bacterium]MBT7699877.1 hypothetical protein [Verrucomicrobiota bacterium]